MARILILALAAYCLCGGSMTASDTRAEKSVINAGVPGDSSAELLSRLQNDVLSHRPNLVIIGVGTNDAINSKKAIGISSFRQNLIRLTEKIHAGGGRVLYLIPPPCYDPYVRKRHPINFFASESPSEKLKCYQDAIRDHCRAAKVPFADLETLFTDKGKVGEDEKSWLMNLKNSGKEDGVHPTPAAYREVARLVAEELKNISLPQDAVIICFGDSITYGSGVSGSGTVEGGSYPAQLLLLIR